MADMAEISQVEDCWEQLVALGITTEHGKGLSPMTYINSAAAIKAFCGERGGAVCTSANAASALRWGLARNPKVFFLPDQHLGRNTGYAMGIPLNEMVVWDPFMPMGGQTPERLRAARIILGKDTARCISASCRSTWSACAPLSGHPRDCSSRVPLGGLPEGRRRRFDRKAAQPGGGRARRNPFRNRNRDSSGKPAGETASGEADHHARRLPAACAPPCIASLRSTCAGRWRTSSTASWSTRSK